VPRGVKVQVLSGLPFKEVNFMTIKEIKSGTLYKEYSLVIPYQEVNEKIESKINEILPTVSIPGFRKGKAPTNIVRKK
jgi:trigger factor